MLEIQFNTQKVETSSGINFFGAVEIAGIEKKVICSVTYEFLEDINNGSTNYIETFNSNLWTIEQIADNKLNSLNPTELNEDTIKITVVSSDRLNYNL